MDVKVFKMLNEADELKGDSYGNEFFNDLIQFYEEEKISLLDLEKLIDCLVNVDETRDIFSDSIKNIVNDTIKNNQSIDNMIELFNACNKMYNNLDFQFNFINVLYNGIINKTVTVEDTLKMIQN